MGKKKKKQFIDKKTSHHFYLMHRSQQDPLYYKDQSEGGSKYILHPANQRTAQALAAIDAKTSSNTTATPSLASNAFQNYAATPNVSKGEVREVDELGLPVDGYDYHQHLATISAAGTFITAGGEKIAGEAEGNGAAPKSLKLPAEALATAEEEQHGRMLEAITLKPESMDPDIRAMLRLDGDEAEEEHEFDNDANDEARQDAETFLDDDFMAQLMQKEDDDGQGEDEAFDFDKHVARLMAEAEAEEELSDEESTHSAIENTERPQRDIDKHFDALLEAQYGDDDIGELVEPEEDPSLAGELEASSSQVVQTLSEHLDTIRIESGKENIVMQGDLAIPVAQRSSIVATAEVEESKAEKPFDMEEVLSQSGYSTKPKPKWDCQTILSTLSTVDNHPALIPNPKRNRSKASKAQQQRKGELEQVAEEEEDHLPGVEDESFMPKVDTSVGRSKQETAEEKRMRKRMVKEQKRLRRQQKKETTEAFKQEKLRQIAVSQKLKHAAAPPEGVSSFKM